MPNRRLLSAAVLFVPLFLFVAVGLADWPDFLLLPDYVATPDGMVVCPVTGELIVACPNFGDPKKPACVIRIDREGKVRKWFDVPTLAETGVAFPMGIELEPGAPNTVWLCDNQNWPTGNGDDGERNQGRLLRLKIEGNRVAETTVAADGIPHPNGVKIRDGFAYVTVSCLPKIKELDGLLRSAVCRFPLDAAGIHFTGLANDPNIWLTLVTKNRDCQYGADGLVFDEAGNLYVGNFGDGELLKITPERTVSVFARSKPIPTLNRADGQPDPDFLAKALKVPMRTTDGICRDPAAGTFYVADFSNNGVAWVSADGQKIEFLALSPDSNGLAGELNQPGEPCLWNGRLAVTCFDMVTGPDKVNTAHDPQATIVFLKMK